LLGYGSLSGWNRNLRQADWFAGSIQTAGNLGLPNSLTPERKTSTPSFGSHDQKILPRAIKPEEMFAPNTLARE
jgi:hypothetical protein